MKYFYLLFFLQVSLFEYISNTPRSDMEFFTTPFISETLTPVLRRHYSRHRNFRSQFGAPILNARAGRSVLESFHQEEELYNFDVECFYGFESLLCAGFNQEGNLTKVECDAIEDFRNTSLSDVNQYALSDVTREGDKQPARIYIFGQNESSIKLIKNKTGEKVKQYFSIHSRADALTDKGLTVLDSNCWHNVLKMFKSSINVKERQAQRKNRLPVNYSNTKLIRTVGYLNIL